MNTSQLTNRINAILAEKGIDKKTFYESCGITSSAFSQWATGKTTPRISTLNDISAFLEVSLESLIGLTDAEKAIDRMHEARARGLANSAEDEAQIVQAYYRKQELLDLAHQAKMQKQKPAVSDELADDLTILRERPEMRGLLHVAAKMTPEQVRNLGMTLAMLRGEAYGKTD